MVTYVNVPGRCMPLVPTYSHRYTKPSRAPHSRFNSLPATKWTRWNDTTNTPLPPLCPYYIYRHKKIDTTPINSKKQGTLVPVRKAYTTNRRSWNISWVPRREGMGGGGWGVCGRQQRHLFITVTSVQQWHRFKSGGMGYVAGSTVSGICSAVTSVQQWHLFSSVANTVLIVPCCAWHRLPASAPHLGSWWTWPSFPRNRRCLWIPPGSLARASAHRHFFPVLIGTRRRHFPQGRGGYRVSSV